MDFPIAHDFNRGFNYESYIAMVSIIYNKSCSLFKPLKRFVELFEFRNPRLKSRAMILVSLLNWLQLYPLTKMVIYPKSLVYSILNLNR